MVLTRLILFTLCCLYVQGIASGQTPPGPRPERVGAAATPQAQKVAPVRSFEAIAASPTEIRLYWLPAEKATGYRIQRDGIPIATLPSEAKEFDDQGLKPDTIYHYSVQAVADTLESAERTYTERTFAPFPSREGVRALEGTPYTLNLPPEKKPKMSIEKFDLVVVQASSGGVAAAYEAGRRGLRVGLVEPTTRIGGMPVNGLSASDLRRSEHAAGFFADFQARVRDLYAAEEIKTDGIKYEPRIAHQAMKSLLYDAPGVTLYRRTRLRSVHTVRSGSNGARRRVTAVIVEALDANGRPTGEQAELRADAFVDATDCGDLAAQAGAPFRLGREARSKAEPHAGVIYYDRAHDKLLPGSTGVGDRRIQAYTYLLTVKDYGPRADKTIPQPPGYRKEDFSHSPAWKESWAVTSGKMPGNKFELNQHPEGGDIQGNNYDYPTTNYTHRAKIEQQYRNRVLSYLYYIQTALGQKQIGLPDDEYRDSGGFPPLLYVREGRRILGDQLPLEADITRAREIVRPESIGIGDYPMDSHAVRPKTDWTTPDMGEGEWWLYQYTPWHELPLGILVPRRLDNVWVTTAVSSTHVSFGTYRLEPVRMAFGQAAGIAAALALRYHLTARQVPARQIQDELLPRLANPDGDPNGKLTFYTDVKPGQPYYRQIQYLAARGIRPEGEAFKADAPTTRGELARWLALLADRSALSGDHVDRFSPVEIQRRAYYPYMGPTVNGEAVVELQKLGDQTKAVTRADFAHWLTRLLPPPPPMSTASGSEMAPVRFQGSTRCGHAVRCSKTGCARHRFAALG